MRFFAQDCVALICAAGEAKAQVVQHAVEDLMPIHKNDQGFWMFVLLLSYKFLKTLTRPYYIGYILGHLEGEQPQLGDLLIMVINHLLNGMILQVEGISQLYQQKFGSFSYNSLSGFLASYDTFLFFPASRKMGCFAMSAKGGMMVV